MSKYAIIQLAGHQHQVSVGDKLVVDRLNQEENKEFTVDQVLLVSDKQDKEVKVGTPVVEKASVTLKVLAHPRSKKLRVGKFRAKSRYRKVYGHRQPLTEVEVTKITG